MMTPVRIRNLSLPKLLIFLTGVSVMTVGLWADDQAGLLANPGFEIDADGDGWPDDWPRGKEGITWETEAENHFLRLKSSEPGKTVMLYREIPLPAGTAALELSWRQRVSNLKVGAQAWFDARIMLEFMDAARQKVTPNPSAPYRRSDSDGWELRTISFLVPEGAALLKFMPSLLQVASGTFDLDDVVLRAIDPAPLLEENAAREARQQEQLAQTATTRRGRAAERLEKQGSLIPNGDLESTAHNGTWPANWGSPARNISWQAEDDNHFLRLKSAEPGKIVMLYSTFDIPPDTAALELTWRQRISGLQRGEMPWFDARFMFEFLDASGKKLTEKPSPSYRQGDTRGWEARSASFLVPQEAVSLVIMPTLFNVKAGTMDIDDLVLKPADPAKLLAAREDAARAEAIRHVPHEEPQRDKWPPMLKVVGNRVLDSAGREVWLQGVNAGGLEILPHDRQVTKSVVVAIDDWQSNCVRLPMKEEFWYGHSPYQKDGGAAYREKIDQIITLAANRGAYLVLDLHRFRAPRQEHADFWQDAAERYKDHPAVLFDLFNEPHGISWKIWRDGGMVDVREGPDESAFLSEEEKRKNQGFRSVGMQALVDAVRSTGAKNIVIAGGLRWCNDLSGIVNGYALDDRDGHGIMYSWHTYNWHPGWASVLPLLEKHPLFLGEVGADTKKMDFIPAQDQEDPYTFVPDLLGFVQQHRIHWTGWCFHTGATPRMLADWNYTPTPFWGQFAKEALGGKRFEMKRMR